MIVTDTEATERRFFEGLYRSLKKALSDKIVIKVVETKTCNMIDKCLQAIAYDAQYRIPWIVFDRDQVQNFDDIIKAAENKDIHVGWSNPCFEIWLFAYFGKMPSIQTSRNCCSDFGQLYKKMTGTEYSKSEIKLYEKLCKFGNEENAIKIAKQKAKQCDREDKIKPSTRCPCTTVYNLVEEIREKIKNN